MATTNINKSKQLTIRVGNGTLSFTITDKDNEEQPIRYEPYTIKAGISMAANLREAYKTLDSEFDLPKARLLINAPVLLIPIERFQEADIEQLYLYTYPKSEKDVVHFNVLPSQYAVCVFAVNKDLLTVLNDHYDDLLVLHALTPVWNYMHRRSYTGHRSKLFGYFHDRQLDIFSFQQKRFKFCNTFETTRVHDSLYFLLYVWKQMNLKPEHDEIHILGDIPDQDWLLQELRKYVHKAYVINPETEFNHAPATTHEGMPFDLMTLLTKGS